MEDHDCGVVAAVLWDARVLKNVQRTARRHAEGRGRSRETRATTSAYMYTFLVCEAVLQPVKVRAGAG
ncbi:hypothetical protein BV20DRAFT_966057 [Pilatotrama ljubarskyi]|nr:hypothetical protein BV20DRAFT_966057 [Pilatotrama ljubarskyi]